MGNEDFWLEYDQSVKEESGGGGIIALCTITTGYKVFPQGVDQADAYFPAAAGDKKAREVAKNAATKLSEQHGLSGRPQWGIMIRADKDNAYVRGQPATWQSDLFWWAASYTDGCKEVVVPSLKENAIIPPYTGWCRIGVKDDPYAVAKGEAGKTDTDQNGEPRFPVVRYVMGVFASKEDAMEAVEEASSGVEVEELPPVPEGYGDEDWQELIDGEIAPALRQRVNRKKNPLTPAVAIQRVAEDFGVDPAYVQAVYDDMQ